MRLINVISLELHSFSGHETPPYAILSHRWSGEEITFEAFVDLTQRYGAGFEKIQACAAFVAAHTSWAAPFGVHWLWIDTCCIDKRSSAELSEAINSMANWYRDAAYCVGYVNDVSAQGKRLESTLEQFRKSVWFSRGWTLQELLFPRHIVFCDREWQVFGCKTAKGTGNSAADLDLSEQISSITSIPFECLSTVSSIFEQSVARRMSWAAHRTTTRIEDTAYCLLGIFGLNLPLLYGEGREAFIRLQEEIIRRSTDESIFAWTYREIADVGIREGFAHLSLLAPDPSYFLDSGDIHRMKLVRRRPYRITSGILEFEADALCLHPTAQDDALDPPYDQYVVELNCCRLGNRATTSGDGEASQMTAQPCMLALRRYFSGTFIRVYHAGLGDDLWANLKSRFGDRTYYSVREASIERRTFPIHTTGVSHQVDVQLKTQAFPGMIRLRDRLVDWKATMS